MKPKLHDTIELELTDVRNRLDDLENQVTTASLIRRLRGDVGLHPAVAAAWLAIKWVSGQKRRPGLTERRWTRLSAEATRLEALLHTRRTATPASQP